MYSAGFGVTLIALCMITAMLILAVTSNVILSLGMVGALSIVRFRTAIKEPSDIAFLFWSIAGGIVLAAGFIPLAVFGSIFIGIILIFVSGYRGFDRPYILVVHCTCGEAEERAMELVRSRVRIIPISMANTGPPMTGTACPRNHDGTAMIRQSRRPAPFFFTKFIFIFPPFAIFIFLPAIRYHKKIIK